MSDSHCLDDIQEEHVDVDAVELYLEDIARRNHEARRRWKSNRLSECVSRSRSGRDSISDF